jgi:hypothetical protein
MNEFEKHFNSDLRNFRKEEVEVLSKYSDQFKESANFDPAMTMYNWPRYVRTNEITRFLTFYHIYNMIKDVQGSILQIGVLEGNTLFSFAHLQENFEPRNYTSKIYGFDTYGENDYAEIGIEDGEYLNRDIKTVPKVSSFEKLNTSVNLFNRARLFNQFNIIELIKGNAIETVPQFINDNPGTPIRLLNMQISLYAVEKVVLAAVWPHMPKGSVVHFASLGYEGSPGVGKFVDDVLGLGNVRIQRFPFATKASYIIKE